MEKGGGILAASISCASLPDGLVYCTAEILMRRQLQVAGVALSIDSDDLPWDFEPDSSYRLFRVEAPDVEVLVDVHWHHPGIGDLGEVVFSARDVPGRFPPNWRLYRSNRGMWSLEVNAAAYPVFRRRVAVFEPDFRRGNVYVELTRRDLAAYPYPLSAPLDRVLFVHIVTHGLGLMLHACGIVHDGKGYIFAGPSNAGKTTLCRLWAKTGEVTVLGDECLILRRQGSQFWVYGTPWVGEAGLSSPMGAPVEGAIFIRHSQQNSLDPTSPNRAAEQLLSQSILTPYDPIAVQSGLDLCLDFVAQTPAYDFGFVPDESAVRLIQKVARRA